MLLRRPPIKHQRSSASQTSPPKLSPSVSNSSLLQSPDSDESGPDRGQVEKRSVRSLVLGPSSQSEGVQGHYQRLSSRGHDSSLLQSAHPNVQRVKYYAPSPDLITLLEPRDLIHTPPRATTDRHRTSSVVELFRSDRKPKPSPSFIVEPSPVLSNLAPVRGPFLPKSSLESLVGDRGRTPVPDPATHLQQFYEEVEGARAKNQEPGGLRSSRSEAHFVGRARARRLSLLKTVSPAARSGGVLEESIPIRPTPPLPSLFRGSESSVALPIRRSVPLGLPPLPPGVSSSRTRQKEAQTSARLLTATLSVGDTVGSPRHTLLSSCSTPSIRVSHGTQSLTRTAESSLDLRGSRSLSGRTRSRLHTMQSRYMTDLEWRICHAVNIYVYQNGLENKAPTLIHIPPAKKRSMKHVMGVVHERIKFPIGYAKSLYKMDGTRIRHPCELEMYNNYVAGNNYDKHFKCVQYGRKRSPLLVLNRESKHIRQLRLHSEQYNTFLEKKKAAGDERPQYVYPAYYTQEGFGPADLPAGVGGNYLPPTGGPACKLPQLNCGGGSSRKVREEDGRERAEERPEQSIPSINVIPAQEPPANAFNENRESSRISARVKFKEETVNRMALTSDPVRDLGEVLLRRKDRPWDDEDNRRNNNEGKTMSTTSVTEKRNGTEKYRSIGRVEEGVFFKKPHVVSKGVIDGSGTTKPLFRRPTDANANESRDWDEVPEALDQTPEDGTDLEVEDQIQAQISAPTPSYTVRKARARPQQLNTVRTQTLEEADSRTAVASGPRPPLPPPKGPSLKREGMPGLRPAQQYVPVLDHENLVYEEQEEDSVRLPPHQVQALRFQDQEEQSQRLAHQIQESQRLALEQEESQRLAQRLALEQEESQRLTQRLTQHQHQESRRLAQQEQAYYVRQEQARWAPRHYESQQPLNFYPRPAYQTSGQEMYGRSLQEPRLPLIPHPSTGFIQTDGGEIEELNIPYTPLDGPRRRQFQERAAAVYPHGPINQQYWYSPEPPPPLPQTSRRNVAVQMGTPSKYLPN